jgi:thiamine pyrophosphate-dependent acetolactate synthase large subunit-like protein
LGLKFNMGDEDHKYRKRLFAGETSVVSVSRIGFKLQVSGFSVQLEYFTSCESDEGDREMALLSGGKIVAKALKEQNISHLFTLCGGHIQDIYDGCLDQGIRVVDFRHEQSAAHAADGWSRVTGQVGVAAVTAGPGVTDAVTAMATAQRAQSPLVLIGGQGARAAGPFGGQDRGGLQEMNHVELMRSVTKWSVSVPETRRLAEYVQSAIRVARAGVPGPVFLEMPLDVLLNGADESDLISYPGFRTESAPMGDPRCVGAAVEKIENAKRPMLIVGSQFRWSPRPEGLEAFLRAAPMPVFLNGMARGSLDPETNGLFKRSRSKALMQADLVIIFGTPLDFRLGYGEKIGPDTQIVQVDLDGSEIGRNRGVNVGIVGDSGSILGQLSEALAGKGLDFKDWIDQVAEIEKGMIAKTADQLTSEAEPVNPMRLCSELNEFLDEKTIVVGDGGDFVATAAYVLNVQGQGSWMDPGPLGTLGVGPGYAMAAKLAKPDQKVVLVMGDGTFGFNGMEFESMVRQGINVVGVMGNDAAWTQILRGQEAMYGADRVVATKLDYTRYDKIVEAVGGHGEYVEKPDQIRPALKRAFAAGKPALVNVKIGTSDFRQNAISV